MNRNLTDTELLMVCEVIASRMGLQFPRERWTILRRNLASAAKEIGFQNMDGFLQWLLSSELSKDQIMILASHLTISETYFWREPQVFSALTDYVLPEIIKLKKNGEKRIRIWSAGCSTGEEPYSIAIALRKTIQKIEDWNITILATDINPRALSKAEQGIYGTWSFRNSPAWLKSNWFHYNYDRQFEIIPEIKKMVTFSYLSLVEMSAISNTKTMDVIFCRNVLMYFTNEWIDKISQNLFHSLLESGWLIVSSSELSSQVFPQFTPINFPGAVLYRKGKNEMGHSFQVHSVKIPRSFPDIASVNPDNQLLNTSILSHTSNLYPDISQTENVLSLSSPGALSHPLQSLSDGALKEEPQFNVRAAEESITRNIPAIRLLAGQGHLEEALSLCNEAISSYKLSSELYFLRASVLQELDRSSEAIVSLKQAIYIDPEFIMGHFTLGNLFTGIGKIKNAERYFKNVLDLLRRFANDDILPESEGLSVRYIKEIVLSNMQTQLTK